MRQILIYLLIGMAGVGVGIINAENKITVNSMPPVVIKTFPLAGDKAVDPSIKEIHVTFSKEMKTDNQWSFVSLSKETTPIFSGKIKFLKDKRTCVALVDLKPGKTYAIWLNKGKYSYFKDIYLNAAIPYLLVFKTKK